MNDDTPAQRLLPSLLDRLIDDDPGGPREPPAARHQILSDLKQAVRRDLENLLNTRVRHLRWAPHLEELEQSLLTYGLPSFSGVAMASDDDRRRFCRTIEQIIKANEPRLLTVEVQPVSTSEPLDRVLHFRIEGLLRVEPVPEPVAFDSVVQPATGNVEVKGAGR